MFEKCDSVENILICPKTLILQSVLEICKGRAASEAPLHTKEITMP